MEELIVKKTQEIIDSYILSTGNHYWQEELSIGDYLLIRNQAIKEVEMELKNKHSSRTTRISPEATYFQREQPRKEEVKVIIKELKEEVEETPRYKKEEGKSTTSNITPMPQKKEMIDELAILAALGDD